MIRHVSSIAEIVDDVAASVHFYRQVLGLEVEWEAGADYAQVKVRGTLHFGIWDRKAAAQATLGDSGQAKDVPLGFSIGFEVDEVAAASEQMEARGWKMAQSPKSEPWGQVTSRFKSPSGALCEVSETPWARQIIQDMQVQKEAT